MARPINPTPVLCGKDKEIFLKDLENTSHDSRKESFLKECDRIFNEVKKDI
ncbi:MAG: hypothetical protein KKC75_00160 [Nanoarchaeota archaeon]|nr:hypothetical protein [Nanoarchaeota archaeon]MBU1004889.1 hypothetical protein [Nanoarchaeota archaeon]MBU1945400.1 hypothetical protein [Nanoarchaeota archaeon]